MIDNAIEFSKKLLPILGNKIHLVSHFDSDGVTSAAIISKTLERLNKPFSLKIIKQLSQEEIELFPKDKIIIMLDLGSGSLEALGKIQNKIFIIDHHEIDSKLIPENIIILNPHLVKEYEELCSAELCYLVSRAISENNKNLSNLAIIGMIGDIMEKEINKTRNIILKEADVTIRKGLLIYPSTRPLDKALEYSPRPFIPGVTGDAKGTFEILKEIGLEKINNKFKSLIELDEKEMKSLVTSVMLRLCSNQNSSEYLGNLYLIKMFNKLEDARELSAIINACSRMGRSDVALLLCLGNLSARKKAERVYVKYRQHIIAGLRYIDKNEKILGREYVIINAKDQIKDTIIGTLTSILSFSSAYKEGTILVAMAYNNDKIKVSTRMVGRNYNSSRNLKEIMDSITLLIGGESGGHKKAAGCTINKDQEEKFIELVKKKLEIEIIKV